MYLVDYAPARRFLHTAWATSLLRLYICVVVAPVPGFSAFDLGLDVQLISCSADDACRHHVVVPAISGGGLYLCWGFYYVDGHVCYCVFSAAAHTVAVLSHALYNTKTKISYAFSNVKCKTRLIGIIAVVVIITTR